MISMNKFKVKVKKICNSGIDRVLVKNRTNKNKRIKNRLKNNKKM